jgi:hypothetical protein
VIDGADAVLLHERPVIVVEELASGCKVAILVRDDGA